MVCGFALLVRRGLLSRGLRAQLRLIAGCASAVWRLLRQGRRRCKRHGDCKRACRRHESRTRRSADHRHVPPQSGRRAPGMNSQGSTTPLPSLRYQRFRKRNGQNCYTYVFRTLGCSRSMTQRRPTSFDIAHSRACRSRRFRARCRGNPAVSEETRAPRARGGRAAQLQGRQERLRPAAPAVEHARPAVLRGGRRTTR